MSIFSSGTDVQAYLSGEQVICLICGRAFRSVGHHVRWAHKITARDYKRRYGLPVTKGACGAEARSAFRAVRSRNDTPERIAQRREKLNRGGVRRDSKPDYALLDLAKVGAAVHGRQRMLSDADFDAICHAIRSGQTITAACRDNSLPGWTWLHKRISADADRRLVWNAMWESLPFSQQARSKKLGARFAATVAFLRAEGMTYRTIAAEVGISEEAVRKRVTSFQSS